MAEIGNVTVRVDAVITDEQYCEAMGVVRAANKRMDLLAAENAKLREQIRWLKRGDVLHVLTDQEYIDQCERERLMQVSIDALDKDNTKLRELVRALICATDPHDRERLIINAAELLGEVTT